MEKLSVRCQHCDRKIVFEERHAGRQVKCPGCAEPLLLVIPTKVSQDILDPFADLTGNVGDSKVSAPDSQKSRSPNQSPKSPKSPDRESSQVEDHSTLGELSAGKNTKESPSKRRKTGATNDGLKSNQSKRGAIRDQDESAFGSPEASSGSSEDSSEDRGDASSTNEPFFDEFGLAELNLSENSWTESSALPPVSKQFLKKKTRRNTSSEPTAQSDSSVSAGRQLASTGMASSFQNVEDGGRKGRKLIYLLFLLTLLPLCLNIVFAKSNSLEERLAEAAEADDDAAAPGEVGDEDQIVNEGMNQDENQGMHQDDGPNDEPVEGDGEFEFIENPEDIFNLFPDQRFPGAFLSRGSSLHLLFAALSGVGFMILFVSLFRRYTHDISTAMFGAIFTATAGIVLACVSLRARRTTDC